MTDWTAIVVSSIAAIPPTLVAFFAFRQSQLNTKKVDTVIEKAVEIHVLTNSSLSKVQASLEMANEKIRGMERLISSMDASIVATAAAKKSPLPNTRAEGGHVTT